MAEQMTEALLKWLSTFMPRNASSSEQKSWNDVSDGVAMAKVLNRIDSHFKSLNFNIWVVLRKIKIKIKMPVMCKHGWCSTKLNFIVIVDPL